MFGRLGLRTKLVLAGAAIQLLTVVILTWNSAALIDSYVRGQLQEQAQRDGPLLVAALGAPIAQRDYATVQAILSETRSDRTLPYIAVKDSAGRLIASEGDIPVSLRAGGAGKSLEDPSSTAYDFEYPIMLEGQTLGRVCFGLSMRIVDEARESLVQRTIAVGAATLVLLLIALAGLDYLLTRPLERLTEATQRIREGDYDADPGPSGNDEIGQLNDAFRRMGAELQRRIAELEDARSRAESADRAKTDFLANMSHELRTPMTGVLGMAELLGNTRLDDAQRRYVDLIRRSGDAMIIVVNDILDLSKIQAGKLEIESVALDPRQLVDEVVELFRARADAKGLSIEAECSGAIPETIHGDPTRIRQVLTNLVGNAVKFTEQGGVRVRMSEFGEQHESFVIAVSDTGIGIPPDALARILEPFHQVDASTTRRYGGTGLGLAIVNRLVAAMGGRLEVESTQGRGSTFSVVLPVERTPPPAGSASTLA